MPTCAQCGMVVPSGTTLAEPKGLRGCHIGTWCHVGPEAAPACPWACQQQCPSAQAGPSKGLAKPWTPNGLLWSVPCNLEALGSKARRSYPNLCAHVGARQARRPKVVPKPRASRSRELGESSTQVGHGGTSPRRSTRLISRSEHALVCLVWALPCQVLSPSQNAMVQNCPSVCMVSRNAQHTQVFQALHFNSLYLVLPWPQLGENLTLSP